jgi:ABC-type transport system involved in cytochrome c biogenesis permease component
MNSLRLWTAVIAIVVIIAVKLGIEPELANKLSEQVLIIAAVLIGGLSLRKQGQ